MAANVSPTIRRAVAATNTVQAWDLSFRLRAEAALAALDCDIGASVLDLGCGVGSLSALLAARSLRPTCVDVAAENIEVVRRRHPELPAVRADATALPFDADAFDAVILMEVLEHIEDDRAALAEISRVIRDNGLLILSVPNLAAPLPLLERFPFRSVHAHEGPERHFRDGYDSQALSHLLEAGGFRVERMTSLGGTAYRLASGFVSLVHLAYRSLRRQQSWTWSDVEADRDSLPLRIYAAAFPALLAFARLGAHQPGMRGATLLVTARRAAASGEAH
jgi:ubiquinone/menaquinone biosynthesis C-methylase UbiE